MSLFSGLFKTSSRFAELFTKKKLDAQTLEELEELLIMSDMGAKAAASIVAEISEGRVDNDISEDEIKSLLADAIVKRLAPYAKPLVSEGCVVVVGVNGNGKTTTIGKLASHYKSQGKMVMLAAADTFRAAAVEQLMEWASRANVPCITGAENSDPAAVAYRAMEQAKQENIDLLFIDTAGRLHTKDNLMAELSKILKTIQKVDGSAPSAVIQVLDATTGQNALSQVAAFKDTAGVTGLIVTKLDGTAKAGVVVALAEQFGLPIHAIGVGEGVADLQAFDAEAFAKALVGVK
ncbi:MAG: signal recognition particle-docking protein FtsY [Alphaproteobacteria bacterium]|nr:signal recognition particle-docking protein FtsY [Alphaproteobacteria bacterium]